MPNGMILAQGAAAGAAVGAIKASNATANTRILPVSGLVHGLHDLITFQAFFSALGPKA